MEKKKKFALVSMKRIVQQEKKDDYLKISSVVVVASEEETEEEEKSGKKKYSYGEGKSSRDVPSDDYKFLDRDMNAKKYIDYMLHRDKPGFKKEKERLLF